MTHTKNLFMKVYLPENKVFLRINFSCVEQMRFLEKQFK